MKKLSLLFSLLVVASIVLTACGGGAPATEAPVAETEAPVVATEAPVVTEAPVEVVEVTFWHAYGTGSAEETALAAILEQAAIDLPNTRSTFFKSPSTISIPNTKLMSLQAADQICSSPRTITLVVKFVVD